MLPPHNEGRTLNGYRYVIAHRSIDMPVLKLHYSNAIVFSPKEMSHLKGLSREESEIVLVAKMIFEGDVIK